MRLHPLGVLAISGGLAVILVLCWDRILTCTPAGRWPPIVLVMFSGAVGGYPRPVFAASCSFIAYLALLAFFPAQSVNAGILSFSCILGHYAVGKIRPWSPGRHRWANRVTFCLFAGCAFLGVKCLMMV